MTALVTAHLVVELHHAGDLSAPDGAVRRADHGDVERGDLRQGALHGLAVFAHDAGVVTAHLLPEGFDVELLVRHAAVQCAERAERIAREDRTLLGAPRGHRLGPVHHRNHAERQRQPAQVEHVALLDLDRTARDAVVALDHLQRLGVADDPHGGIGLPHGGDRSRVVGLHVVYHQIIQRSVAQPFADVGQQTAREAGVDRIDERRPLAADQIGVVRHAERQRPQPLEKMLRAVVHPDVENTIREFCQVFHNGYCNLFIEIPLLFPLTPRRRPAGGRP